MNISLILPPIFSKYQFNGYTELVAMNLYNQLKHHSVEITWEIPPAVTKDIYIIIAQFHDEVISAWIGKCINACCEKSKYVIVCGKSASVEYQHLLKTTTAYGVVIGEPDYVIANIVDTMRIETAKAIPGFAYKNEDEILIEEFHAHGICLDDMPMPDYSFLSSQRTKYRISMVETSRECHGRCNFCEGHIFRKQNGFCQDKMKSPERVVDEITDLIKTRGNRIFTFTDDNFFGDGKRGITRALQIANLIQKKNIKIKYTIDCRADDINLNVFKELKQSGLLKVYLGFESGDNQVLARYQKDTSVEMNLQAINILNQIGVICQLGMIYFDPLSTIPELQNTIDVVKPLVSYLYSYSDGIDTRKMFIPSGSGFSAYLASKYSQFDPTPDNYFCDPEVSMIFKSFENLMNNPNEYRTELEKQINALDNAIKLMKRRQV